MILWHCGSRNCPTHRHKAHRCKPGVWFCGRKEPPCPGHVRWDHRCGPGRAWSCGCWNCPGRHAGHRDRCPGAVWVCGRKQPPCPTHQNPSDSCTVHLYQAQLHGVSSHFPYKLVSKGKVLENRKAFVMGVFERCGIREERRGLMLAMAMIENELLVSEKIDHSKDNFADKSANTSIFNLNEDMLRELGYKSYEADYGKVIRELNDDGALPTVVGLLNQAFDKWTVVKTLHWLRGGYSTFIDDKSYDTQS